MMRPAGRQLPAPARRKSFYRNTLATVAALFVGGAASGHAEDAAGRAVEPGIAHGIAMHGAPALPATFTHQPHVNPFAPKGGRLIWGIAGAFDSLNPLIVRGMAPPQIRNYVIESLLARGADEPFTLYGLLAQSVETDDARSFVTFRLNPKARFSDGQPVTSADVLFSWRLLRDKGRPNHRLYYSKVATADAPDKLTVRFDLSGAQDRELPLILGLMPILPAHAVDESHFEDTSLKPPLGSGPYRVSKVEAGSSVTLTRDPDYWGRDLPINKGLWNFDEIRLDYYREANAYYEAFVRGLYDFRVETEALRWKTGYAFAAVKSGNVVLAQVPTGLPRAIDYLVFNTRRPIFADVRVREALGLLFDFEWLNRNYFHDLFARSGSYFAGSELSAYGRAASDGERKLLAPFAGAVRPDILDGAWQLTRSDGSGRDRANLTRALALLEMAGYTLQHQRLINTSTGAPFAFQILVMSREQERIALSFASLLKRAGIDASIRNVDAVQFDQRRIAFDFDMIPNRWDQSLSPGNEQAFYWGSEAADAQGSRNYMGVKNPAIDAMIEAMLAARDRTTFVEAVRALDRVLMSGFYAIPIHHAPAQWLARRKAIGIPPTAPLSGILPESWWRESESPDTRQ